MTCLLILLLTLLPSVVFAGDLNTGDTAWILTSTALVLFMTLPGLALFYSGLVRAKNVLSVLMQCFAIACLVSIMWMVGVYGLAFGDGGSINQIIGLGNIMASDVTLDAMNGTIPEVVFFMFQMTFAIITPALIIGAFAERMKFSAVLWFSAIWLILVYAPVCHWVWGGGWLADKGFMDFAGGAVVHINAGVAAIVTALVIGNRKGFPEHPMAPHNMTLVVAGGAMLWVGWFGFNGGSALGSNNSAGMAIAVTHISAAAGSLAWMVCEWIKFKKPSVLGIVTGMVAGLGTITPASGFVGPLGGLAIGLLAGVVCFFATQYIKRVLKIDDSLDVFPVHGVGGILGTLLTAVFYSNSFGGLADEAYSIVSQLGIQAIGVVATIVWCGVITFIILKVIDRVIGLRVNEDEETEGLDLVLHNESGYNI
ncbi:MAG TPA: ammonium transporter [Thiotrichaceae bacterium]|jgi:Amt family ammonium transporter|nr:ammonium transporter [Thiotrichaceae bacterium]HIM07278.1 ammonium transporter [Gammaproteobacteria bacterium]